MQDLASAPAQKFKMWSGSQDSPEPSPLVFSIWLLAQVLFPMVDPTIKDNRTKPCEKDRAR